MKIEKIALILSIIFSVLTFVGAGLVIGLKLNAGYAVVPAALALSSSLFSRKKR